MIKVSIDKFSSHYRDILTDAIHLAVDDRSKEVTPHHILTALMRHEGGLAHQILQQYAPPLTPPISTLEKEPLEITPILNEETISLIDASAQYAQEYQNRYIGTEHLLFAFLRSKNKHIQSLITHLLLHTSQLEEDVLHIFDQSKTLHTLIEAPELDAVDQLITSSQSSYSALEAFTHEITDPQQTELNPVIGREYEIGRAIEILLRKTKNNPLLLGEPGVGKTAIVEGLAHRIMTGNCPVHLKDKKIFALDINALVAGTMYRGEFEARLKELLSEIEERDDVILFIDEVHTIVGAGSSQGSMDIANILKPALARGDIRCIGATTYAEYKKHLKQDMALDRRFHVIHVNEPTPQETYAILKGSIPHYEKFHGVQLSESALQAAISLSCSHMPQRQLPDKAFDVLDEACSMIKVKTNKLSTQEKLHQIEKKLSLLTKQHAQALIHEQLTQVTSCVKEQQTLLAQKNALEKKSARHTQRPILTESHVARVVARHAGIPANQLLARDITKLKGLHAALRARIHGQDEALRSITATIQRARLGLTPSKRPRAAMIFAGPSGVGKTQTAKLLAEQLFHTSDACIKIDMSEFSERHTVAKLTGAPAGYIGYKEDTPLIHGLRKRPHAVVLFDEIEKAHPDVFNLFLQILDEGYLTDSAGEKISFEHTYIIFTSNLGSQSTGAIGFNAQSHDLYHKELKQFLRPELLYRMDSVVCFNHLSHESLKQLAQQQCSECIHALRQHNITLSLDTSVYAWLAQQAQNQGGVRMLHKLLATHIQEPALHAYLQRSQKKIRMKALNDTLVISYGR